jgi:cell wall-associated NlpC family hydrolase
MHKLIFSEKTIDYYLEKVVVIMLQKKTRWRVVLTLCMTMILIGVGCTNKQTQHNGQPTPASAGHSASILVANESIFSNIPVYRETNGLVWIPLEESARSMSLDLHNDKNSFAMGNTDPAYSVVVNQTQALRGDNPIELPQAPKFFDRKPYITTQAFSTLMGTQVNWNEQQSQVVITPIDDSSLAKQQSAAASQSPGSSSSGQIMSLSLTTAKKSELISLAETFSGTPYKFGSGPYESTHTFDCSSFVQYVYARFGVDLPRSTRTQSQVGQTVEVNQLQPGDLMFFYTPGRYASNRIVGHVGIYAGNGKIVQTYGKPGVTVSDFNPYWRGRFLFAKRV